MDRRRFIKTGAATTAALLVGPDSSIHPAQAGLKEQLQVLGERIISGELMARFQSLPEQTQKDLIKHLNEFTFISTGIGNEALRIISSYRVLEKIDESLPKGTYSYNTYSNSMVYNPPSSLLEAKQFLGGEPFIMMKAHEYIHHIQDISSSWDPFESFFRNFVPDQNYAGPINVEFTKENAALFAENMLGEYEMPYDEARQRFTLMWNQYDAGKKERNTIREIQAYTSFLPYTTWQSLMQRMTEKDTQLARWVKSLPSEQLDLAFKSTITLLGMLGPDETATFVGAHGDSIENYVKAVSMVGTPENLRLAYQEGMERQKSVLKDIHSIMLESAKMIDIYYER
ncbi:MAG: twin-arginine translocation signal domain-containing protein [Nanoarchaeota archaeon]|nr:twin-arginine translocation signal domain-containing protein [Nanoarchaeota archaeon]